MDSVRNFNFSLFSPPNGCERNLKEVDLEYRNIETDIILVLSLAVEIACPSPGSQLRTRGQECANVWRELW